jgi:hypothetical protein
MFNKYGKKALSLAMASAMVASMAIPAFADSTNTSTTVSGAYQEVPISVTVPQTGTVQINPYGLPVEYTKSANSTKAAKVSGQQIVTQPLYISNEGDVALDISVSVTTTVTGPTLVTSKPADNETDKKVYLNLEMKQSANKSLDETGKDKIIDEFAADATWTDAASLNLVAGATPAAKDNMATLAAAKVTGTGSDKVVTYNAGSIVLFRLAGNVTTKPTTAWATTDTISSVIAFTFTPHVETTATTPATTENTVVS